MHGLTLPFVPTKAYDPISVNLRDKQKTPFPFFFLSLCLPSSSSLSVSSFFFSFDFSFFLFIIFFHFYIFLFFLYFWIHDSHYAMCLSFIRVRFYPKTIYLFSVQFILNELRSSHSDFRDFRKNLVPGVTDDLSPRKIINIFRLSHNSMKLFRFTGFREMNPTT